MYLEILSSVWETLKIYRFTPVICALQILPYKCGPLVLCRSGAACEGRLHDACNVPIPSVKGLAATSDSCKRARGALGAPTMRASSLAGGSAGTGGTLGSAGGLGGIVGSASVGNSLNDGRHMHVDVLCAFSGANVFTLSAIDGSYLTHQLLRPVPGTHLGAPAVQMHRTAFDLFTRFLPEPF